ncbi:hypothetical protein QT970_29800, partial [Microcoleus sp. herbarium8]|uniref:hypothetical protein n=1 Tax=Microcoleus sp. herbarium8 TaxID=3055436 RepID=UPI002FD09809
VNSQQSTVNSQQSTVNNHQSTVNNQQSTISGNVAPKPCRSVEPSGNCTRYFPTINPAMVTSFTD